MFAAGYRARIEVLGAGGAIFTMMRDLVMEAGP